MGRQFLPADLPEDFWSAPDAPQEKPTLEGTTAFLPAPREGTTTWQPQKLQFWYDGIIDIMIAQPGVKLVDIAAQLHKSPITIGLVVRSDMFKLRYEERRKSLAEAIDSRISQKLAKVAEKGLDLTLELMETKGDKMGVGAIKELTLGALDRLGYSPQAQSGPSVVVNNTTSAQATTVPVSADVLAEARAAMSRQVAAQGKPALANDSTSPQDGEVLPPVGAGGLDAL